MLLSLPAGRAPPDGGHDGRVTPRRLLPLVAVIGLLLVVAVGAGRASYDVGDGEARCPERVWSSAWKGLTADRDDPGYACAVASQERLYAVAAGVMGLVLISGLLSRRD